MTPQEKAKELYQKFHYQICNDNGISENESNIFCAIQCVIICVDEILKDIPRHKQWSKEVLIQMEAYLDDPNDFELPDSEQFTYYQSVINELNKMQ